MQTHGLRIAMRDICFVSPCAAEGTVVDLRAQGHPALLQAVEDPRGARQVLGSSRGFGLGGKRLAPGRGEKLLREF